ncbi:MAG TPA: hypothetical protein DEF45_06195 [Rhodopirellula sp.]|nr:hypothetical protein [Rhodopirellula sp.]
MGTLTESYGCQQDPNTTSMALYENSNPQSPTRDRATCFESVMLAQGIQLASAFQHRSMIR